MKGSNPHLTTTVIANAPEGRSPYLNASTSHRGSFFGRLSLRQYISELFDTRTYAPIGEGVDASNAHLLKFSHHYWPDDERLRAWLEPKWEAWRAKPPSWFKASAMERVERKAAPDALPTALLRDRAEEHAPQGHGGGAEAVGGRGGRSGGRGELPRTVSRFNPRCIKLLQNTASLNFQRGPRTSVQGRSYATEACRKRFKHCSGP